MDEKTTECPLCGSVSPVHVDYQLNRIFYGCPVCGRYDWGAYDRNQFNHNHLASYLAHHRFPYDHYEYRYHTTLDKETCDQYNKEHEQDEVKGRRPVHMDSDMVENWFPKTFSERVDYILLYIDANSPHIGQQTVWSLQEAKSALFIDRYDNGKLRNTEELKREVEYMLNCLQESGFIQFVLPPRGNGNNILSLTPEGYKRVDELQKYSSHGHNAFVAMQFGDDTKTLREAIREGITKAGYNAILIDEVQHNELITPELLKCIRDSKVVVTELTHQNNGAYFEEGYPGREVDLKASGEKGGGDFHALFEFLRADFAVIITVLIIAEETLEGIPVRCVGSASHRFLPRWVALFDLDRVRPELFAGNEQIVAVHTRVNFREIRGANGPRHTKNRHKRSGDCLPGRNVLFWITEGGVRFGGPSASILSDRGPGGERHPGGG